MVVMEVMVKRDLLWRWGWLNVIVHVIGLFFALFGMRPGTPSVELVERMGYLAGYPWGWIGGWVVWMVCTLVLVGYCATLVTRLERTAIMPQVALMVAGLGGAIDIFCDALLITVMPMLAAQGEVKLFIAFERMLNAGGLIAANGLYSIAVLLFTLAARARVRAPLAIICGYGVFISGMLMCVAGYTGNPRHLEIVTGPTIILFSLWTLLVAHAINHRDTEIS